MHLPNETAVAPAAIVMALVLGRGQDSLSALRHGEEITEEVRVRGRK